MKGTAVTAAVAGFFAMAIVGWLSGVQPLTCGLRALAGAVVLYVLVRIVCRIVIRIMADVVLRGAARGKDVTNYARKDRE